MHTFYIALPEVSYGHGVVPAQIGLAVELNTIG
jgi:hypothetical protein